MMSNSSNSVKLYHIFGLIVGIPLIFFVLYTYIRDKKTRKHPASLLVSRTIIDGLFIGSLLWLSNVSDNNINSDESIQKNICLRLLPLVIFFFVLSQFYFIGMCYDLFITLTKPLQSQNYTLNKIHSYCFILSSIFAILVYIFEKFTITESFNFKSGADLCFFNDKIGFIQVFVILLPLILGIISGLISIIYITYRIICNSISNKFTHSKNIVYDHTVYVICYSILMFMWILMILIENKTDKTFELFIILILIFTPLVDALSWYLQKYSKNKMKQKNKSFSVSKYLKFLTKSNDDTFNIPNDTQIILNMTKNNSMSEELRMELISSMMEGICQSLDHIKNLLYKDDINPTMFPPMASIYFKKGSKKEKEYQNSESIHPFLLPVDGKSVRFIEYGPHVFKYLREQVFNITHDEFLESVTLNDNANINSVKAKFSEGKSGAFFYMTHDEKYMVKTVSQSEAKTLLRILPGYFEHVRKYPGTLITKFCGFYSIKLYGTRLWFIIMKNVFPSQMV